MKKRISKKILKECIACIQSARKYNVSIFCSGISPEMMQRRSKVKMNFICKEEFISKINQLKTKALKIGIDIQLGSEKTW